jgi:hypothetical protein
MGTANTFRDMRCVTGVAWKKRTAGTAASGVVDTRAGRGERMLAIVTKGSGSGAGALKTKFYESDTLSGTASGMTIFASSASNLTASATAAGANRQAWDLDLRKRKRFIGIILSTGTASAIAGVDVLVGDLKVSPPSATDDGYASYTTIA